MNWLRYGTVITGVAIALSVLMISFFTWRVAEQSFQELTEAASEREAVIEQLSAVATELSQQGGEEREEILERLDEIIDLLEAD